MQQEERQLFCALLKYWRHRRGMSQLDLAMAADVSHRHLSFLETGRAGPSREMLLRLGAVLEIPLRDQNALLSAAGFAPAFPEADYTRDLPESIKLTLRRMLEQHEPFPLFVLNRRYDVLEANRGARIMLAHLPKSDSPAPPPNLARMLFDPKLGRPAVVDWERAARALLSKLHREALTRPGDLELKALVQELFEYPDVPNSWRQPDFSDVSDPTLPLHLRFGDTVLGFLTAITSFSAPQNVTLDEIRIESYFPLDAHTRAVCERLQRER